MSWLAAYAAAVNSCTFDKWSEKQVTWFMIQTDYMESNVIIINYYYWLIKLFILSHLLFVCGFKNTFVNYGSQMNYLLNLNTHL